MLSDDEIDAALKTEFPSIVALIDAEITAGQFKVELRRLARAVERAAYERAAALVIELTEDSTTADAIRALGRQHD